MRGLLRRLVPQTLVVRRPALEHALCLLLCPRRLSLPKIILPELAPGAETAEVRLQRLPEGPWATPLVDVVHLLKLVATRQPASILELGCYKGHTTAAMAQHAPQTRIVTVDLDPAAGEAFRGTPLEARIERRIGHIDASLFRDDERFDLIFVDADHTYEGVRRDSDLAMSLVAPTGLVVWHDYANFGYFSGHCGVPEYLAELAARRTVKHLAGTNLAVHAPVWRAG